MTNSPKPATYQPVDYSLSLAKKDLSIFPVIPDGKVPFSTEKMGGQGWKEYSTVEQAQLRAWAESFPGCNFAVDCGKAGLFVLDIDNKPGKDGNSSLKELEATYGELPATFTVKTPSGGYHRYFKGAGKTTAGVIAPGIDTRSVGGYVVAPGSRINGSTYEPLIKNFFLADAPEWLINMAGKPNDKLPATPKGDGQLKEPGKLYAALQHVDPDVGYGEWLHVGMALHHASGGGAEGFEMWDEWSSKGGKYQAGDCEKKWQTFKNSGVTELSIFKLARENGWGGGYAEDDEGRRLRQLEGERAFPDILQKPAKAISAAELMAKNIPAVLWIVSRLLAPGLGILAGRPKLGKSWTALQLAISVTLAQAFLSFEVSQKSKVAYLALEDGLRRLQDRLRKMLAGTPAPEGLYLFNEWRPLDQGGLDDLKKMVTDDPEIKLIIIDTWQKVRPLTKPKGASAYEVDYAEAGKLKKIADDHGCHILLIHHLRKTAPGINGGDIFEKVNGSSGITGAADTLLILDRHRNVADAELHVSGRDVEEGVHLLARDQETMGWNRVGGGGQLLRSPEQQQLLRTVEELKICGPKDIAEQSGLDLQYVKNTLPKLLHQGVVKRVSHGRYEFLEMFPEDSKSV